MKVVLFCGGLGLRLKEYSENVPKPMVPIGYRPIIWHVMKYYAHYGHRDFVLCLGYKADVIKRYFLEYDECISNDFVLSGGNKQVKLLSSDTEDWRITFVDTGLESNIGSRLMAVRRHLEDEEVFLANYSDNLTDAPLPEIIERRADHDSVATFLAVRPSQTFHVVRSDPGQFVSDIYPVTSSDIWINGGYFVLRNDIFQHMEAGEELVLEPFQRLIRERALTCYRHTGFWASMDTFKEKQTLEEMHVSGRAPWQIWKEGRRHA